MKPWVNVCFDMGVAMLSTPNAWTHKIIDKAAISHMAEAQENGEALLGGLRMYERQTINVCKDWQLCVPPPQCLQPAAAAP